MKPIAIIKLGDTYPEIAARYGGFVEWAAAGIKTEMIPHRVIDLSAGAIAPDPSGIAGAVITGSHAMLTEHPEWNAAAARWLRRTVDSAVPVLGICYGHQLLAHAFGGRVGDNPNGREFGTVTVHLSPVARADALMRHLPETFVAHACHRQSVLIIPDGAVPLAWNDHDPYQAFRIGATAWGVQFHPEFPEAAVRAYITAAAKDLAAEGRHPKRLLAAVGPTPEATGILRRFSELVAATARC